MFGMLVAAQKDNSFASRGLRSAEPKKRPRQFGRLADVQLSRNWLPDMDSNHD